MFYVIRCFDFVLVINNFFVKKKDLRLELSVKILL